MLGKRLFNAEHTTTLQHVMFCQALLSSKRARPTYAQDTTQAVELNGHLPLHHGWSSNESDQTMK
eukprot:4228125-Amphidinium_carterae.1